MNAAGAGRSLPTRMVDARNSVLRLHAELHPVLAGYPIGGFLSDYLQPPEEDGDPAALLRQRDFILRLLHQWAELLWRDMAQLPPADHELVRQVRRRMASERQGLLRLHDAIEALPMAPPPALTR